MLALAVDGFSHLNFALLIASLQTFVLNGHEGSFPIIVTHPAYLISIEMDIGQDMIHDSVVNSPRQ